MMTIKRNTLLLITLCGLSLLMLIWFNLRFNREIKELEKSYHDTLLIYQEVLDLIKGDQLLFLADSQLEALAQKHPALWLTTSELINQRLAELKVDSVKYNAIKKDKLRYEELAMIKSLQVRLDQQKLGRLETKQDSLESALFFAHQENLELWQKKEFLNDSLLQIIDRTGRLLFSNQQNVQIEYFGEKRNGEANGFGFGFYETGSLYRGSWIANRRHGNGIFIWKNGDRYEGEFKNDSRSGKGIYYFRSGEKYIGQWNNDLREGNGKIVNEKGQVLFNGVWEKDKPIRENQADSTATLFD